MRLSKLHPLFIGLLMLLFFSLSASILAGAPHNLPGIALGSSFLLHAERTLILFVIVVTVLTVLTRGLQGNLPVEFSTSGLRFEETVLADDIQVVDQRVTAVEESLQDILSNIERMVGRAARNVKVKETND